MPGLFGKKKFFLPPKMWVIHPGVIHQALQYMPGLFAKKIFFLQPKIWVIHPGGLYIRHYSIYLGYLRKDCEKKIFFCSPKWGLYTRRRGYTSLHYSVRGIIFQTSAAKFFRGGGGQPPKISLGGCDFFWGKNFFFVSFFWVF